MRKVVSYLVFILLFPFLLTAERVMVLDFANHSPGGKNSYYGEIIFETIVNRINVVPQRVDGESFENEILKEAALAGKRKFLEELYLVDEEGFYYLKSGLTEEQREELTALFARLSAGSGHTYVPRGGDGKVEESLDNVLATAALKRVGYIISGYYSSQGDSLKVVYKIYDMLQSRQVVVYEINESLESTIFDIVNSSVNELFRRLEEVRLKEPHYSPELTRREKVEQSKFIGEPAREFMVLFKLGVQYAPIVFGVRNSNNAAPIDITSVLNRSLNSFAPTFEVEFYRSVELHYFGAGCRVETPVFVQTNNFYSNSLTRVYFAFAFRKQFFFKWGFDYYFLMYDKYSDDKKEQVQTLLMTFGASFDFTFMPRRFPFYVEAGFTIYPSWIYSDEDIAANNSQTEGGGGPRPFTVVVGRNRISSANYILPFSPRLGVGYFTKSGIGFFLSYSMTYLQTRYDDILFNTSGSDRRYYLGDETAIINKLTLGVMYRGVIK